MKQYEKNIIKKFQNFDEKNLIESFIKLWRSEKAYFIHIQKRLKYNHIKDEFDYLDKTIKCLSECEKIDIAIYQNESWDNIYYQAKLNEWAVIFNENGDLMTSYQIDDTFQSFEEAHKFADKIIKGANNGLQAYFKKLYDRIRNTPRE